jgi:hypothetical protein
MNGMSFWFYMYTEGSKRNIPCYALLARLVHALALGFADVTSNPAWIRRESGAYVTKTRRSYMSIIWPIHCTLPGFGRKRLSLVSRIIPHSIRGPNMPDKPGPRRSRGRGLRSSHIWWCIGQRQLYSCHLHRVNPLL